ncbi:MULTISPECIES: MFS transporter [unclassified Brenneria]|uniref:MFS transporter n=1 Tax=unclassified Brenneria TaxID=2634434 RepID=UPI0015517C3B|nr:MFS transporter [Brenneria sp. hezel4-2-4]MEE3649927.1 MFS transporter [Brenneria sp. HEZEL_4_2_4]NPC99885.1 MFS transporter [Brenneria sp. hezel4-2-4]
MRGVLTVVLACHFLAAFTVLGVPLFLPTLLQGFGIHAESLWIGVLYSLPTVATALSAPLWGRFADRFGRRLSLQRALLGLTAAFVMAGLAPSLPWLIAALLLQGIAGGTLAAANGYLAVSLSGAALGNALNWTQFSARLALLCAPAGLGLLISATPVPTLRLYLWLAVLPLAGFVLSLSLPLDDAPRHPSSRPQPALPGEPRHPAAIRLLSLQFLFNFAMVVTFPYFLPFAQHWLSGESRIGLFYSWPHLLYLLLLPLLQRVTASSGHLGYGLTLMVIAAFWHSVLDSAVALLAARTLFGIGILFGYNGINRLISQTIASHNAGHEFGRLDAAGKWAGVAAGLSAAWLCAHFSVSAPFIASGVVAGLALFIFLFSPFKESTYEDLARRP